MIETLEGQMTFESFLDDFNKDFERNLHPGLCADDGKCEHYRNTMCNRYGISEEELKKLKPNPQWACSGCCYYCAAHHDARCKWDCRVKK